MDQLRLIKYAELITKGSKQVQDILFADLESKEKFLQKSNQQEILNIIKITERDLQIIKRIKRWIDSRETNIALKELNSAIKDSVFAQIKNEIISVINLSQNEEKKIVELKKNIEEQLKILNFLNKNYSKELLSEYSNLIFEQRKVMRESELVNECARNFYRNMWNKGLMLCVVYSVSSGIFAFLTDEKVNRDLNFGEQFLIGSGVLMIYLGVMVYLIDKYKKKKDD